MDKLQSILHTADAARRKRRRMTCILLALSTLVSASVFRQLTLTGITATDDALCGIAEHLHDETCPPGCALPEHTHSTACFPDLEADVETYDNFIASLPSLDGHDGPMAVTVIAQSQLGQKESAANFALGDDGIRRGITRYGQWYGNPYGDWSAMFAAFCLHFAGYTPEETPYNAGAESMHLAWKAAGLTAANGPPRAGDLLFLDDNADGTAERIAVVVTSAGGQLITIEGDVNGAVAAMQVAADDARIVGIGALPERRAQLGEGVTEVVMDSLRFDADAAGNGWQIVAESKTSHSTATFPEGATGDNVDVKLRKYVEPTGVEDEFLVHLEIDKKLSWKTVFEYGDYIASAANGNIGAVVQDKQGNPTALYYKPQGEFQTPFYIIIQIYADSSYGTLISQTDLITLYTKNNMSNGQILLKLPDRPGYAMVIAKVDNYQGSTSDNPVYFKLYEELLNRVTGSSGGNGNGNNNNNTATLAGGKISVTDTTLETVVDTLGDNIEFIGVVSGDYATTPVHSNGVLTWIPKTSDYGDITGETGSAWHDNAARLTYRVRLKHTESCAQHLSTGCTTACEHSYEVNESATLTYSFSNASSDKKSATFPKPYVRGLLYDIHFTKVGTTSASASTTTPLAGAEFTLTGNGVSATATSQTDGSVSFTGLRWGTYTITETQVPKDYDDTNPYTTTVTLCYTTSPELLQKDTTHADRLMLAPWTVTNTQKYEPPPTPPPEPPPTTSADITIIKTDQDGAPLAGAVFLLEKLDGGTWTAVTGYETFTPAIADGSTAAKYTIVQLPPGTYRLTETSAPGGYMKLAAPVEFTFDGTALTSDGGSAFVTFGETSITIVNLQGVTLPNTGGGGSEIYLLAGLILLLFPIAYAAKRRRAGN